MHHARILNGLLAEFKEILKAGLFRAGWENDVRSIVAVQTLLDQYQRGMQELERRHCTRCIRSHCTHHSHCSHPHPLTSPLTHARTHLHTPAHTCTHLHTYIYTIYITVLFATERFRVCMRSCTQCSGNVSFVVKTCINGCEATRTVP
jgi:hypothetical protein